MDGKRFDDLSRRLATRKSRRGVLGLIGAAATGLLARPAITAAAKPQNPGKPDKPEKEKPEKDKPDKPTKCYGEGSHCTNGKQCCSNICTNRQCAAAVPPECVTAADCAGIDDECQTRTCIDGICGVVNTAAGTPLSVQISGDCQLQVCDGAGGTTSIPDDSDLPTATNDCADITCTGGVLVISNWEAGTQCESNGGSVCNGSGQCGACTPGEVLPCSESENAEGCEAIKVCLPDGSGFDACFVPEVGSICDINLLPLLGCGRGTVQCVHGQLSCCSTTCSDATGGPFCLE